jgi:hypothetical protein
MPSDEISEANPGQGYIDLAVILVGVVESGCASAGSSRRVYGALAPGHIPVIG